MVNTTHMCAHVFKYKHKQSVSHHFIFSVYYFILYILLKTFRLILSHPPSLLLCVISSQPPSCLYHYFTSPCCNFSISIFHLIFPEQRAVLLNYLAPPEIWVKKQAYAHTGAHTNKQLDLWLWVWICAAEKCEMVILEL